MITPEELYRRLEVLPGGVQIEQRTRKSNIIRLPNGARIEIPNREQEQPKLEAAARAIEQAAGLAEQEPRSASHTSPPEQLKPVVNAQIPATSKLGRQLNEWIERDEREAELLMNRADHLRRAAGALLELEAANQELAKLGLAPAIDLSHVIGQAAALSLSKVRKAAPAPVSRSTKSAKGKPRPLQNRHQQALSLRNAVLAAVCSFSNGADQRRIMLKLKAAGFDLAYTTCYQILRNLETVKEVRRFSQDDPKSKSLLWAQGPKASLGNDRFVLPTVKSAKE